MNSVDDQEINIRILEKDDHNIMLLEAILFRECSYNENQIQKIRKNN